MKPIKGCGILQVYLGMEMCAIAVSLQLDTNHETVLSQVLHKFSEPHAWALMFVLFGALNIWTPVAECLRRFRINNLSFFLWGAIILAYMKANVLGLMIPISVVAMMGHVYVMWCTGNEIKSSSTRCN